MKFADLGLSERLLKAVTDSGYDEPTPIQAQAIPSILMMRDLIGIAQTGTGKTASFVLPMIDILAEGRSRARMPRSLILEPTRELAAQVAENFEKYGKYHKLSMALLIGGVSMGDQVKALEKGVDVLIATPGRLMDLFDRGNILLTGCDLLVIDEADRMLDMGFIPDIEHICTKLPANRQTLLFSATMPPPIKKLSDQFLSNPKYLEVARPASANASIEQRRIDVAPRKKNDLLRHLLDQGDVKTAIIFCNRKTTVRDLNKSLRSDGFDSGEIHGDIDQASRQAELERFKDGTINLLVASDVAARGLDIKGVSHVFNYDAPWHPDDYVHRIGRTGRAGASGKAVTFVTKEDAEAIDNIEKLIKTTIEILPNPLESSKPSDGPEPKKTKSSRAPTPKAQTSETPDEKRPRRRTNKATQQATKQRAEASVDKAPVQEKPKPARRSAKAATGAEQPSKARQERNDAPEPEEGWNGPIPGFLSARFGD